ncbi:MAG: hypothetical protein R8K54_08600 [Mariprofundaceae bacterium]
MEIQTNVSPAAAVPAIKQYNQDLVQPKSGSSVASGIVVDIQSRQEPLGVALSSSLQSLVENSGLSETIATNNQSSAIGPEGVATRLSSVAAHIVSSEVKSESVDSLSKLFDSIKQSIDQGFEEAARVAANPADIPLQQAKDLTHQQLNAMQDILGLRDNQA